MSAKYSGKKSHFQEMEHLKKMTMKTLDRVLNHFTILNSGHDISNRSTGVKLVVMAGMLIVIALAVLGAIQLYR